MLIAQIEGKISRLRQGDDMSVMAYVAELQALWAEQDNCDPLELYDAASIELGRKWIARRRVLKLLEGLRGCFNGRGHPCCTSLSCQLLRRLLQQCLKRR